MCFSDLSTRAERTLADLRRAARTLAQKRPLAEISAEDIADAAGVSRRTFFNYFSTTYEAFLPGVRNDFDTLERLAAGEPADLADALGAIVVARARVVNELRVAYPGYLSALVADPHMRELLVRERYELDIDLRRALARRLGISPQARLVNVLSHVAFTLEHEVFAQAEETPWEDLSAEVGELVHALADALARPERGGAH